MSSYPQNWVTSLIEDLYIVKDTASNKLQESVQQTIDLLDDLILSGYTYDGEENSYYVYRDKE